MSKVRLVFVVFLPLLFLMTAAALPSSTPMPSVTSVPTPDLSSGQPSAAAILWQAYCDERVENNDSDYEESWRSWQADAGQPVWLLTVRHNTNPNTKIDTLRQRIGRLYRMQENNTVRALMLVAPSSAGTWSVLRVSMGEEMQQIITSEQYMQPSAYDIAVERHGGDVLASETTMLFTGRYYAFLRDSRVFVLPERVWMSEADFVARLASPGDMALHLPAPVAEAVTQIAWSWSSAIVSDKISLLALDISEIPRSVSVVSYGPLYTVDITRSTARTFSGLQRMEAGWLVQMSAENRQRWYLFEPDYSQDKTTYHAANAPVTIEAINALTSVFEVHLRTLPSYWMVADNTLIAWADVDGIEYAAACTLSGELPVGGLPFAVESITQGHQLLATLRETQPAPSNNVEGTGVVGWGLFLSIMVVSLLALHRFLQDTKPKY